MSNRRKQFTNNELVAFTQRLKSNQEDGTLCDFTILGSDGSVRCHKIVLSSSSSYFSRLFRSDDHNQETLETPSVSVDVLNVVLSALYSCSYTLDADNLMDVMHLSIQWRLHEVIDECWECARRNINLLNACDLYTIALQRNHKTMKDQLSHYIREHFVPFAQEERLHLLSVKNFCKIIAADRINVDNEDIIFTSAMAVIEHDQASSDEVSRCLELIRIENISHCCLANMVRHHPLMNSAGQQQRITKALSHQDQHEMSQSKTMRRYWHSGLAHVDNNGILHFCNPNDRSFSKVIELPKWTAQPFNTFSASDHSTICIAGYPKLDEGMIVTVINLNISPSYDQLPVLNTDVCYASLLHTKDDVYIIGGMTEKNRECIDSPAIHRLRFSEQIWWDMTCMPEAVHAPLVIMFKKSMFVLGGEQKRYVKFVQEYNQAKELWVKHSDLKHGCSQNNAGVVIWNHKITVVMIDKCMLYTTHDDTWVIKNYPNLGEGALVQAMVRQGQLCAVVQTADDSRLSMKTYDWSSNNWTECDLDLPHDAKIHSILNV